MSGASLLQRLERNADQNSSGRSVYRSEDLESVVMEHLAKLLNTRAGSSTSAPDYGIVEVSEMLHDFPDAHAIMQRSIKNTVSKYEPRLKNVQVRVVESDEARDNMVVSFEVTAQLVYPNGDRQPIRFATNVDQSSNVNVG